LLSPNLFEGFVPVEPGRGGNGAGIDGLYPFPCVQFADRLERYVHCGRQTARGGQDQADTYRSLRLASQPPWLPVTGSSAKSRLQRLYGEWGPLLKASAVVVAAGWALFEYNARVQDGRVEATLNYRKALRSEPLFSAWRNVLVDGTQPDKDGDAAALAGGHAWISYVQVNGSKHREDIDVVISLFDEVNTCVQLELCDKQSAYALFGTEAKLLYDDYGLFITCQRISYDKEYADGFLNFFNAYFVDRMGRQPRATNLQAKDCT
jgi:hypothetical protein